MKSASATYANADIRINSVAPGILDTQAAAKILSSELTREMAAKQYPIKGIGNPEDVADLITWLLSEPARRVTGQVWSIDGGFSNIIECLLNSGKSTYLIKIQREPTH